MIINILTQYVDIGPVRHSVTMHYQLNCLQGFSKIRYKSLYKQSWYRTFRSV